MAYCRFGPDSDVYLYLSTDDCFHCCGCGLIGPRLKQDFVTVNHNEILKHLEQHIAAGHKVPPEAVREIEKEAAEPKVDDSQ
jgi:hypothetical protein